MIKTTSFKPGDFWTERVAYITIDAFTVQEIGRYGEIFWMYQEGKWFSLTREEFEKRNQG